MGERLRGRAGVAQRKRRLQRTKYLCEDCLAAGFHRLATIVDHTLPLALGGEDTDDNTRNLCDDHNRIRTAEQFGYRQRQEIGADGWPTT
jgi:5-methylcytosine-specific restriction protein A